MAKALREFQRQNIHTTMHCIIHLPDITRSINRPSHSHFGIIRGNWSSMNTGIIIMIGEISYRHSLPLASRGRVIVVYLLRDSDAVGDWWPTGRVLIRGRSRRVGERTCDTR
jgi:hypothetical protein